MSTGDAATIRGLSVERSLNYFFTGDMDGGIHVFEWGKPGKERLTKLLGHMHGIPVVTAAN